MAYSLGHELGTMFGFLAACVLTVGAYSIIWHVLQRRAAARDQARRNDLHARGFHHERGGYHDRALNEFASRDPVAQTQGQTLKFLTEPDLYTDLVGGTDSNTKTNTSSNTVANTVANTNANINANTNANTKSSTNSKPINTNFKPININAGGYGSEVNWHGSRRRDSTSSSD